MNQKLTRRSPRQQRAQVKVELMFEAAVRILEQHGLAGFNTNRIAELAGVSIGTLYQYFPDKQALLAQLAQREIRQTFDRLALVMPGSHLPEPLSLEQRVRAAVHVMLGVFDGRVHARRALMAALVGSGQGHLLDEQIQQHALAFLTQRAGAQRQTGVVPLLSPTQALVLARAVSAALRAGVTRDEPWLQRAELEDALCALILGFLDRCRLSGQSGRATP